MLSWLGQFRESQIKKSRDPLKWSAATFHLATEKVKNQKKTEGCVRVS